MGERKINYQHDFLKICKRVFFFFCLTFLSLPRWTDLIIGAPNFFDRKAEIGGAVYVYLNPFGHWDEARPIRLNGTYDSMFGMIVSSVGDLDQDGYGGDFYIGS